MHASIWMPFPPSIWQCIGLQLNTESSWANQKMDRKGGSRSAARKNQCGTRSTRLVKSSETVDKSKPRDVWTYETYVISLGTVRFSVWSSYSRGQIHPGALRVRMTRCLKRGMTPMSWSSCWHGLGRSVVQGTKNWLRSARSAIQEARWCFLGS